MALPTPFILLLPRFIYSYFYPNSPINFPLSFYAWYRVFSNLAFPDSAPLTSFSMAFNLATLESSSELSASHSSSNLFLSSLSDLRVRLKLLFYSLLR